MADPQTPNTPAPGVAGASPATPASPAQGGAVKPASAPIPATQGSATPAAGTPPVTPAPGAQQGMVPLAALHEERGKRQQLQSELDGLRATVEQMRTTPQQQQQVPQQQQPQTSSGYTSEQIEKLWEEDPKQAVRAEMYTAFTWYDQVNAQLDYQADQLSVKYPDFGNFRSGVMNYMRSMPLAQRNPAQLEQAYFMVRGQQFDTVMKSREAELMAKFNAPANFQSPTSGAFGPGGGSPAGTVTLTPEQVSAAAAMGLSPEEYASGLPKEKGR
jgi:hypothetical protein